MKLHGYWRSSAAYRVRIALNLKGLQAESATHALPRGEQRSEAYLALNPQGLVPALETEDGVFIQSTAIIEYLDERWPQPSLLPSSPAARAVVRGMAGIISADIHPINNLRILKYLKNELGQAQAEIDQWARHWIIEGFTALEAMANPAKPFLSGDAPGLADVFLVPQMANARRVSTPLDAFPTLVAIDARATALEPFARAHPDAVKPARYD